VGEGYNFKQLRDAILALSQAGEWEVARREWSLVDISEADDPETCLCGHFPIIEICTIANRLTGHRAEIGNRCVKRFLGLRSDLIFAAIKRIRKDITKGLNEDAVVFFNERGLLTSREYKFLKDTLSKRVLSPAQAASARASIARSWPPSASAGFRGPTDRRWPSPRQVSRKSHSSPIAQRRAESFPVIIPHSKSSQGPSCPS